MSASTFQFETQSHFCFRVGCRLHLRPGDPGVQGEGNWARIEGGIIIGRRLVDSDYVCDLCIAAESDVC